MISKLKASHFPEKHSVRFVSRSEEESTPFYFADRVAGHGSRTWQVERSEFDRMLLEHAREHGVEVLEQASVDEVLFEDGLAVGARVTERSGSPYEVRAKVTVDASGRAVIIGRQRGLLGEVPGLRKASLWAYYEGGHRLPGIDAGETTIFRIAEGGWFWYIPLPDDVMSVGVVGSPEYLFAATHDQDAAFLREGRQCGPLQERLADASRVGPIRGCRKLAYMNRQTCGNGWVMIGDARAFLDPIYSSGLFLAVASAELAAPCVHEALEADDVSASRLGRFEADLSSGMEVIRRLIYAFYDPQFSFGKFVQRFPEHRGSLIDCLIGDVVQKDMSAFVEALAKMSPPPEPL